MLKRLLTFMFTFLLMGSVLLSACAQSETAVPPAEPEIVEVEVEVTRIVEGEVQTEVIIVTATPSPTEPPVTASVGGTLRLAINVEPETLDIYRTSAAVSATVVNNLGGTLTAVDSDGNFIPYLAESWEVTDDGLVWTFHLKQGVKFHNGDMVTASDWVYGFLRAKDPEFVSPVSKGLLAPVVGMEAVDDYTLVLMLEKPYFPILMALSMPYLPPVSKRAVEEGGENYGRAPVGAGPYMFKEWLVEDKITLERNPDFNWGPEYFEGSNTGAYYIETLLYRILPESATVLTGLEANELDQAAVLGQDVEIVENAGFHSIYKTLTTRTPYALMNNSKPPFDNVLVRQAFSYATNRQQVVNIVTFGLAVPQYGPITPAVIGYWPGVGYVGQPYNLEKAKSLLVQAGYSYTTDGVLLDPSGTPFKIQFHTGAAEVSVKIAQVLKENWEMLGLEFEIVQYEGPTLSALIKDGDFEVANMGTGWPEADILYIKFHSSMAENAIHAKVNDPVLDEILERTRSETDPVLRQDAVNEAQKYITENAIWIPLYSEERADAFTKNVEGVEYNPYTGFILSNAYFINP